MLIPRPGRNFWCTFFCCFEKVDGKVLISISFSFSFCCEVSISRFLATRHFWIHVVDVSICMYLVQDPALLEFAWVELIEKTKSVTTEELAEAS